MSASPVVFEGPDSPTTRKRKPARHAPATTPPRPALVQASLVLAGGGLGVVIALTVTGESASQLAARGGVLTFAGSLTGMVGSYLALIMVLLHRPSPGPAAVSGGQFFCWRFLARGMWWQAHPYSLSALPRPPYLRLTVKAVGDHSFALASIRPGTKIAIEGPYGAFTRYAQRRPRALLVAAGIGVTALRSLLEDLPRDSAPVVLFRASRPADLVLSKEVRELVRHRRGRVHELVGSRAEAAIDEVSLPRLVPDLDHRDLYVCGPEGFVTSVVVTARNLGIPDEAIHHEAFAL